MAVKKHEVDCSLFEEKEDIVFQLRDLIESGYCRLFIGVLVHGSIATAEIVRYSDFDGLLIVRDEYRDSKILNRFIKESIKIIYDFDPLQHHGWFIIYEGQLDNYSQNYFPLHLYKLTKVIYPDSNIVLNVVSTDSENILDPVVNMLAGLQRKIDSKYFPKNLYQLKGFLSQIMLLPALYLQGCKNMNVSKKESFTLAKFDFTEKEWLPISIASEIRKSWNYELNFIQRFLLKRPERILRKLSTRYTLPGPGVPGDVKVQIGNDFYEGLQLLINKIRQEIE